MVKIAPSILSADFVNLERDITLAAESGADWLHVDVMDGLFVPNISIGLPVVSAIKRVSPLPLDVHLMIERPLRYVERFCKAGADLLTVHVEADTEENTHRALELIRECGAVPSLCIKPKTPAEAVLPFLEQCGMILMMTVEPGFGGQSFMRELLPKLAALRGYIERYQPGCYLEVDGGINEQTALEVRKSGANVLVAGSSYFGAPDRPAFVAALKREM